MKCLKRRSLSVDTVWVAEESYITVRRKFDFSYTCVTDLWWVFADQKASRYYDP